MEKTLSQMVWNRRFLVTGALTLFSVFFLGYFSQADKVNPLFQTLLVSTTFFLVVPVLYSKIVLKESLDNWGWQKGRHFPGAFFSMTGLVVGLGTIFVLTKTTSFAEQYFFPVSVQTNFVWFLLYELVLVAGLAWLYEVFFRGQIQLLWLKDFGLWSVVLQTVFFVGLLYLSDDISWQRLPVILFCPIAGLIAYYSQSLWYSWIASFTFFFLTDIFLLVIR